MQVFIPRIYLSVLGQVCEQDKGFSSARCASADMLFWNLPFLWHIPTYFVIKSPNAFSVLYFLSKNHFTNMCRTKMITNCVKLPWYFQVESNENYREPEWEFSLFFIFSDFFKIFPINFQKAIIVQKIFTWVSKPHSIMLNYSLHRIKTNIFTPL